MLSQLFWPVPFNSWSPENSISSPLFTALCCHTGGGCCMLHVGRDAVSTNMAWERVCALSDLLGLQIESRDIKATVTKHVQAEFDTICDVGHQRPPAGGWTTHLNNICFPLLPRPRIQTSPHSRSHISQGPVQTELHSQLCPSRCGMQLPRHPHSIVCACVCQKAVDWLCWPLLL